MSTFLKATAVVCAVVSFNACSSTQENGDAIAAVKGERSINNQIVEASCGQCQFDMKQPGCNLAVRIDGKSYFVDGANIDDFGDAHAADGFCEAVRMARVSGSIEDGRFRATEIVLLPEE